MQATVVSVDVKEEDRVIAGQPIAILEAMKMEHVVAASASGIVRRINVRPAIWCLKDTLCSSSNLLW